MVFVGDSTFFDSAHVFNCHFFVLFLLSFFLFLAGFFGLNLWCLLATVSAGLALQQPLAHHNRLSSTCKGAGGSCAVDTRHLGGNPMITSALFFLRAQGLFFDL